MQEKTALLESENGISDSEGITVWKPLICLRSSKGRSASTVPTQYVRS